MAIQGVLALVTSCSDGHGTAWKDPPWGVTQLALQQNKPFANHQGCLDLLAPGVLIIREIPEMTSTRVRRPINGE